ncbi:MAG TPA: methionine adenosyltransferase, partial [Nitrososphaeraceae archaeon]|jgi:S-adenosylmethionine synthetase|nr:methionine adenosyltransferase [Nitrososphaeraceae archaeon]
MVRRYIFTSESVTEGHPDKICDQVSDSILDEFLTNDSDSRVAVESLASTGIVLVAGEVTSRRRVDIQKVVRSVLREIGYDRPEYGFDCESCSVLESLHEQSPDISLGVTPNSNREQGAGDQGLMFGFATNETEELMPLPILMAHKLSMKLSTLRKQKKLSWIRPDGKSQVSVVYEGTKPVGIDTVVISTQHAPDISLSQLREEIVGKVIKEICMDWITSDSKFLVNPTGRFVIGGPQADTGLTGRKVIADTYGGVGRHGGGAFSGKDPSKVDRSACYMARYIAKNIVAADLADKCEVQLAYAIGVADPVSIMVNTFGTSSVEEDLIEQRVKNLFKMKPADIIQILDLKRPIYRKTAVYGHFGRNEPEFTWERTDKARDLARGTGNS